MTERNPAAPVKEAAETMERLRKLIRRLHPRLHIGEKFTFDCPEASRITIEPRPRDGRGGVLVVIEAVEDFQPKENV